MKEKINLSRKNTNDCYILSSEHTVYANIKKSNNYIHNVNNLIKKRKKLIKNLKNKGVKIKKKTNDRLLKEYGKNYMAELKKYRDLEKNVIEKFNEIYSEGLYAPTCDNKKLQKAESLKNSLTSMNFNNQTITIINKINSRIEDWENKFKKENLKTITI